MKHAPFTSETSALRVASLTLSCIAAAGLLACGGDDDDPVPTAAPTRLQGTVANGAAVPNAAITVKDSDAATADVTGTAGADGKYDLDVSTLRAPLVVSAVGRLNGEAITIVAAVPALTGSAANTANVTSLTNAVAALIAPGGDLNALTSPTAIAAITAATAANASALVVNTLKSNPAFASLLGAGFDPLTTPFTANGTGVDSVLDQVSVDVGAAGVAITNLSAPATESGGQPVPVTLTPALVPTPAAAPTLAPSATASELPTAAEMAVLAKKYADCVALPLDQRVTLDADKQVTAVSTACNFGPAEWKSDGGNWLERVGTGLRYTTVTGSTAGAPTIAVVYPAPNHSGTTFQHPYCNTQICVVMNIPMTSASGKPWNVLWQLGKIGGQWNYVGNQLPYAMGVEQRLNRKLAINTAGAVANPSSYFYQDRIEAAIRPSFNPEASDPTKQANVRAVVWKGPGLPAAGLVTHRSQRCGTEDRFPITNQEGILTVNNTSTIQYWNLAGATEFIIDAAKFDGTALALPVPTTNWSTSTAPANQDYRSAAFTGSVPAWTSYTAEIYYYTNTGTTPDEVVPVRAGTPFERAAVGATKVWPTLASAFVDQYLKPTGSGAGSITSLAQTINWTNPSDAYVNFAYLFSQNQVSATNSESETANYYKRGSLFLRPNALGDTSAPGYEWAANRAGTALSSFTSSSGSNPNPRCTSDELVPLEGALATRSYREAGLQFRGPDRKLYSLIGFWNN